MPRRAWLSLPGMLWHMIQRGNTRSACFDAEEDDRLSLDRLIELSQQFGCAVHAYALDFIKVCRVSWPTDLSPNDGGAYA
jgi:putative transposase